MGNDLFGEAISHDTKKLHRVTVSIDDDVHSEIEEIANIKNLSLSEVVNLLVKAQLKTVKKQSRIIQQNPIAVAFDLITKD